MSRFYPDIPGGFDEVLIDSGGFQLQTGVAEVYLGAYSLWLQFLLPKHPEVVGYFNLDVRDPLVTLQNQFYLESEGLNPIPVWHAGSDPIEYLDFYCLHYPWVSIGGLASSSVTGKKALASMVNWIMTTYPGTKFHILGMGISGTTTFRQHKPYSVDFSTWSAVARFGHAIVKDKKQFVKEIRLPDEQRARLRVDNNYMREITLEGIRNLKYFEDAVNSYEIKEQQQLLM